MIDFDPYGREYTDDPYALYARLREESPVYHNEAMQFWALSRYEDVINAHNDNARFSSASGVTIEGMEAGSPFLILKDPPEHKWAKQLVARMFTRARMAELDVFIRERVIHLPPAPPTTLVPSIILNISIFNARRIRTPFTSDTVSTSAWAGSWPVAN